MTEKCDTKQEILKTALKLFSAKGYESTSVAEIADAVGIRKASLYSHFTSKKVILDELVQAGLVHYNRHSIFANADWDDPTFISNIQNITPDEAQQMITGIAQALSVLEVPEPLQPQMAVAKAQLMAGLQQFLDVLQQAKEMA